MRSCSGPGAAAASYSRRVRAHNRTRTHLPLFGKRIRSALRRNNKTHYNKDSSTSPCQGLLTHRFRLRIQPRSRVRQLLKISIYLSAHSLSSLSLSASSLFLSHSLSRVCKRACSSIDPTFQQDHSNEKRATNAKRNCSPVERTAASARRLLLSLFLLRN